MEKNKMFGKSKVIDTRSKCERGIHTLQERYDAEVVKSHTEMKETQVKKTYLFDICTCCGEIFYPEEEVEEKKK